MDIDMDIDMDIFKRSSLGVGSTSALNKIGVEMGIFVPLAKIDPFFRSLVPLFRLSVWLLWHRKAPARKFLG